MSPETGTHREAAATRHWNQCTGGLLRQGQGSSQTCTYAFNFQHTRSHIAHYGMLRHIRSYMQPFKQIQAHKEREGGITNVRGYSLSSVNGQIKES